MTEHLTPGPVPSYIRLACVLSGSRPACQQPRMETRRSKRKEAASSASLSGKVKRKKGAAPAAVPAAPAAPNPGGSSSRSQRSSRQTRTDTVAPAGTSKQAKTAAAASAQTTRGSLRSPRSERRRAGREDKGKQTVRIARARVAIRVRLICMAVHWSSPDTGSTYFCSRPTHPRQPSPWIGRGAARTIITMNTA